jgi:L-cysteine S-thiosulfotransferase
MDRRRRHDSDRNDADHRRLAPGLRWCCRIVVTMLVLGAASALGQDAHPPTGLRPADTRSGYFFTSRETQAMQDDDSANPGILWVQEGEALWRKAAGPGGTSCASCHGDATVNMKGVAARYPAFDARAGLVINLEQGINVCRVDRQAAPAFALESRDLLALTTYVAHQSRGLPIEVITDGPARPYFEAGRAAFFLRQGQFNLACAQCHDERWGQQLRGHPISQGHGNAYPAYRLEWQSVGSLQRRLRNCNIGVRAEPYPYGAQEYVNLELFLAWRASGLRIETPGVRR